jgi:hypothetical protein
MPFSYSSSRPPLSSYQPSSAFCISYLSLLTIFLPSSSNTYELSSDFFALREGENV